jgi:DNA replication protein DnaC
MLNNQTISRLREMKLPTMAAEFAKQLDNSDFAAVTFEERLGLLVDAEWISRKNNRLERLIRGAGFVFADACLENVEYHADRKLDKSLITRLGTCNYVKECRNLILLGASGCGKSWLANAFGMTACRNYHSVKYVRLPDLLGELAIARADGSYRKVVKKYKQVELLILDEWLLYPLKESDSRELLEIVENRHKRASTIFCSQFEVGGWHQKIGEPTLADAVCDRIVHDSYTIVIHGEHSMRKRKGIPDDCDAE